MKITLHSLPRLITLAAAALLGGSASAALDVPASRVASTAASGAVSADPWWGVFGDPLLDGLVRQALASNHDLQAAAARVEQARAAAGLARSAFSPEVAVDATIQRGRTSATTDNRLPHALTTTYAAPLVASWELDLFGRVRHLAASARADARSMEAAFAAVRLSLAAEVAATYLSLRGTDRELAFVAEGVAVRRRGLEVAQARYAQGVAMELDVVRAEAELAGTEAEAAALQKRRATLQHALAVLAGSAPTALDVPAAPLPLGPGAVVSAPAVPADLPSALLTRRPDIAAAEQALAASHARIGVAKAAFFPAISLTGGAGFASGELESLFKGDSRVWSIGPSLYLPIFQGGRNRANLARARAVHDEAVAAYRQRVLVALREVHDALTATRLLAEEAAAHERALVSARRAVALAQTRYEAGYVSYLEVLDAQRTALGAERTLTRTSEARLHAIVALIKSLGGGWSRAATEGRGAVPVVAALSVP